METPLPPVLKKDAICDKNGILIQWIAPSSSRIDSYTVSWKAESWWQSAQAIVPNLITEFLITAVPANEKVSVWIYSSNEYASSSWSDAVEFVTSRDCGKLSIDPDIVCEVPVSAKALFDVMYTKEFDQYAIEAGLVSNVEHLVFEEAGDHIKKIVRVTPPIPEALRSITTSYFGDQAFTYDEHSKKYLDRFEIEFEIKNVPIVNHYIETSKGRLKLIEVDANRCRLEGFFDLRVNYPVIGYYVAQVIRAQVVRELTEWPEIGVRFLKEKKGLVLP